ncbi:MAG TPA: hypothetical protein VEH04_20520 [Verrucomicrobiae bacterium]|nr:hypothetical protein [Verrucomicrobiae bacterium]
MRRLYFSFLSSLIAFLAVCQAGAADSGVLVQQDGQRAVITWPMSAEQSGTAIVNLDSAQPLIESLAISGEGQPPKVIARGLNPVTILTVGSRDSTNPQGWGAFFDNTPRRHYETYAVQLGRRHVRTTHLGTRTTVSVAEASAGTFAGDLRLTFYRNSPLIHVETVLKTEQDWRAIIYDTGLSTERVNWDAFAWNDPSGQLQSVAPDPAAEARPIKVAGRTLVARNQQGSLAVFPAPHRFFYPQDEAYNLHFVWQGSGYRGHVRGLGFGIRQSTTGDNRYVPWFNAPPGTEQSLGVFYLLSADSERGTLDEVARYTRGDHYKRVPGHITFTSHYHVEHSKQVLDARKRGSTNALPPELESPGFIKTFKARGAEIVHLAEYHYEDGSRIPEAERLHKLTVMHEECRRLSDDKLLLLPGEEPNVHLGGHWLSLFPKPINWTLNRPAGKAFMEETETHGKVYRVGNPADVLRLFEAEGGLMWTAHPRIKASFEYPDRYRNTEFFRSDRFLGAAWKAMPADLSRPTLGWRVLDLLDDMSNWGAKKQVLGEVDTFLMEPDFETYAHMNMNYLRLAKLPRFDEGWQPVLDALRSGAFFTTTGEILIPRFNVGGRQSGQTLAITNSHVVMETELEWTFPLSFAEVVSGDGEKTYRQRIDLSDTESFGHRSLRTPVDLSGRTWVRFEVWDIAANGAFTQPVWIERQQ